MLEEEQKSLARNKKLLEDIDRLEEQMRYFSHECKQDEGKLYEAKVVFHVHKLANKFKPIACILIWYCVFCRINSCSM
jgi:hypothetical protein